MSDKPPNRTVIDIVNGDSDLAANGFAALNNYTKPKEEDDKSNDGDSLFGGRHDTPAEKSPYFNNVQVKQESIEEDDDDDFMIVDEANVPAHVKAKFAVRSWRPRTPDLEITDVRVKQEPDAAQAGPQAMNLNNGTADPKVKDERRSDNDSLFGDVEDHEMGANDNLSAESVADAAAHQDDDEAMFVDELDEPAIEDLQMEMDNILENVFEKEADAEVDASRSEAPARKSPEDAAAPVADGPSQTGNRSGTAGPSHAGVRGVDDPGKAHNTSAATAAPHIDLSRSDAIPLAGADDPGKAHNTSAATAAPHIDLSRSDALQLSGGAEPLSGSLFGADATPGTDNQFQPDASQRFETPSAVFLDCPAASTGLSGNPGMAGPSGSSTQHHDDADVVVNDNEDADGGEGMTAGIEMEMDDYHADDDHNDDDEFHLNDDQELSDGEQPRGRRRKAAQKSKGKRRADETSHGDNQEFDDGHQDLEELTLEDMKEELEFLKAEINLLNQRKAKGKLGPGDVDRFKVLTDRFTALEAKISQPRQDAAEFAQEELRRMGLEESENDEAHKTRRQPTSSKQRTSGHRIPAIDRRGYNPRKFLNARKRRLAPVGGLSEQRSKRQKTAQKSGRTARPNTSNTTETILNMVRSQNPFDAQAQIEAMRVFEKFEANTVAAQFEKLEQQIRSDPQGESARVKAELKQLRWARSYFGRRYCKPKDGFWVITGLKKPLHHYQLVGAGWMLHRELHPAGPFGGILADQVGLGKTIEALACILGNQQAEGKMGTLVVVPANLVCQWRDEIEACCPHLIVLTYHSSQQHRVRWGDVEKADIVVTTYQEVCRGYPNKEKQRLIDNLELGERAASFQAALGKLFKVDWHRIILDEAHAIKNHLTHTFKACNSLRGKYRWALTATPLHNGLYEIYPYMQFIRADNAESFREFKQRTVGVTMEDVDRAKELMGDVMMLRRLETAFLGRALFQIPKTHPLPNTWISLSEEENIVYRCIEDKVRQNFNRALAGKPSSRKKSMATFFSIAVRLRQAATHPFLLFKMMRDFFELEDIKEIRQKLSELRQANSDRTFIDQIGRWCDDHPLDRVVEDAASKSFGQGDHGLEFNMDPQLEKMERMKDFGGSICNICDEPFQAPRKTKCGHVFCRDCLDGLIETERDDGSNIVRCPTCNHAYGINDLMEFDDQDGGPQSQSQSRRRETRRGVANLHPNMPGNDHNGLQPLGDGEGAKFLDECDRNVNLTMAPSAKTAKVKELILKWQKDFPNDKIIVFTQWVMVGRILGRVLQQEKIPFLYYFGDMTRSEKEDNVKAFHALDNVKVLIASLKCGGQGLNLTCANRVIMIDPWWNSALEHQGYGRVYRMGQTKETYYVRLLTRKTIDGRMAKLQALKLEQINNIVTEYDSTKSTIQFEEVGELFGRLRYDEEGNVAEVVSDYDSEEEDALEDMRNINTAAQGVGNILQENNAAAGMADAGQPAQQGGGFGNSVVNGYGLQDLV
ncbi:SNF2 family N-terminal domain-containing protein [Coniochaeta sp. 2T2.1]|nr:SNF2 family N-terminal domain-containing protein [Coniochaeta sp. 2T2.1]